jgi:acyl-coenzyme A thioesterase PaaI-like protein
MIIDPKTLKPVPNSAEHGCFGCGARNPQGLKMTFSTDGNRMYSFIQVPPTMTGWDTTVHGGVLSTILDEIMGWAVICLLKKIGVTKSMTTEFIKAVKAGESLTVVGAVQEIRSERSALMSAAIYNPQDTLCVKASALFTTMHPKAAVRLGLVGNDYVKMLEPALNFTSGAPCSDIPWEHCFPITYQGAGK